MSSIPRTWQYARQFSGDELTAGRISDCNNAPGPCKFAAPLTAVRSIAAVAAAPTIAQGIAANPALSTFAPHLRLLQSVAINSILLHFGHFQGTVLLVVTSRQGEDGPEIELKNASRLPLGNDQAPSERMTPLSMRMPHVGQKRAPFAISSRSASAAILIRSNASRSLALRAHQALPHETLRKCQKVRSMLNIAAENRAAFMLASLRLGISGVKRRALAIFWGFKPNPYSTQSTPDRHRARPKQRR